MTFFGVKKTLELEGQKRQHTVVVGALLGLAKVEAEISGRELEREVAGCGRLAFAVDREHITHLDAEVGKREFLEAEHIEEFKLVEFVIIQPQAYPVIENNEPGIKAQTNVIG